MNEFYYNGRSSRDFGIFISGSGTFNAPERDAETISIPGKNGDLEVSHNRFKNIAVEYPAFIVNNFKDNAAAARAWLLAASGYHRLEDTYHGEYFRLGRFTGPLDFDMKFLNRAGEFKLQFDCKPQRFLKSGEEIITTQFAMKNISGNPITVSANANGIKSVKLHGKTTQSGTGDPSPTNIRPIYGVGQFDKKGEIPTTGWAKRGSDFYKESAILDNGISSPLLSHSLPYVGTFDSTAAFSAAAASYTFAIGSGASNNIRGRIYIKAPCATVEELSNWLQTINRAVYYQSTSYSTAEQVYAALSITDANGYYGYAAGPMAPLYEGDTVDFVSGKVNRYKKMLIMDGSTINKRFGAAGAKFAYGPAISPSTGRASSVCSHFKSHLQDVNWGNFYITGPNLDGTVLGLIGAPYTTSEELNAFAQTQYSKGTPIQLLYQLATPTTETVPISEPIINAAGTVTLSAENTLELVYEMLENGFIYNPTEFTALPLIRVYGTAAGTLMIGNTIVQINAISEYVDLDCELQDAFKGITNCNGNVYAPDFPTLPPGGTGISFSGGITKIEIKPRWWTV